VEQRKSSKRQAQAAATQELLLATAHEVFAEKGYQATTVGAITAQANTAHGTFYLYFRNKEDVFAKVVESVVLEMYDHTWSVEHLHGSQREVLERTLRGYLEVFVRHAGIWRCLLEGAFTTPSIEAAWRELRGGFISRTARSLTALHEAGLIRDVDVDVTANALGGMVEWAATTQFVLRMPPVEATTFEETVATLTDLWYHALFTEVRSPRP
jgi:AcrR family transcriptional regulator